MKDKCKIENCQNECSHGPTGYCNKHYVCWYRTGNPIPQKQPRKHKICSVEGCNEKHRRNGFCATHSHRFYRHGDPNAVHPNKQTEEEKYIALKQRQKKYNKTVKGKAATKRKRHRRRHLESSDVNLSSNEYSLIFDKFNNKCFNCKRTKDLTFDHHIPLSKGGKLEFTNIVLLCRKCNGLKSDKDPDDFYSKEQLKLLESL